MKKTPFAIAIISGFLSTTCLATTLSEALISTYQNNPELIAERESLKKIDEQMYKAISGFLPKIQFSAGKNHQRSNIVYTDYNGDYQQSQTWTHNKTQSTSLNLEQNLFNGGKSVMAVQMAKYIIEAHRARLLFKEQEVLLKAINVYLEVINKQRAVEINKENVQGFEKRYIATKDRFDAGVIKQADLSAAEANKETSYANLANAEAEYASSLAAYIQIIGLPSDNLSLGKSLVTLPANQLELLQKSLNTNPAIIEAEFNKKAADLNVKSDVASMLPRIDLTASMGKSWLNDQYQGKIVTVSNPVQSNKSIGIQLIVPIFNQGLEYSTVRESSAEAARLKSEAKRVKNQVTQGATQYWSAHSSNIAIVKAYENTVKASQIALDGKQQEYNEGHATLIELLQTQTDLFNAKIKLNAAQKDLEMTNYNIASLMGEVNAKDLALETKLYNPSANYEKVKLRLIGF